MSYEIGMRVLNLEPTDRVGRTEYCFHWPVIRRVTGLDPASSDPAEAQRAQRKFWEWAEYDLIWSTHDGPKAWEELGRTTDMGHSEYAENGVDVRQPRACPFKSVEEALNFDAAAEYGGFDVGERSAFFERAYRDAQASLPSLVYPGGYYKTIVSGCIQTFGWEMFLEAVGVDAERFGEYVLEGFFQLTLANVRAWAKTGIKAFIQHDDMVWTSGAIFKPDWYRRYIFPRYKRLWEVLHEAGVRVLFCSDGDFTEFVDDVAAAGADGFIFEPLTSLEYVVERYGRTHVMVGNADCRVLTFGDRAAVKAEVERCMRVGKPCPGFVMAVGNHIPVNIPMDNVLYYFDLVRAMGGR